MRFHAHEKSSLQLDRIDKMTGENGGGEMVHFIGKRNQSNRGVENGLFHKKEEAT